MFIFLGLQNQNIIIIIAVAQPPQTPHPHTHPNPFAILLAVPRGPFSPGTPACRLSNTPGVFLNTQQGPNANISNDRYASIQLHVSFLIREMG